MAQIHSNTLRALLFILFINFCTSFKIGTFYSDRPPSYIESKQNQSAIHRRDESAQLKTLQIFVYTFPSQPFETSKFNLSLNAMFEEWKLCSLEKQQPPAIKFNYISANTNCLTQVLSPTSDTFYMHVILDTNCVSGTTIGMGQVDGIQSWIFNTVYTYSNRLFAHELGHNFGLLHAARDGDEYGDFTCVMGTIDRKQNFEYATCFNSPHTQQLLWNEGITIISDGIYDIPNNQTTFLRFDLIYYIQFKNNIGYVYEKLLNSQTAYDTLLKTTIEPGLNQFSLGSFIVIYQNDKLYFVNNTSVTTKDENVLTIILFLLVFLFFTIPLLYFYHK